MRARLKTSIKFPNSTSHRVHGNHRSCDARRGRPTHHFRDLIHVVIVRGECWNRPLESHIRQRHHVVATFLRRLVDRGSRHAQYFWGGDVVRGDANHGCPVWPRTAGSTRTRALAAGKRKHSKGSGGLAFSVAFSGAFTAQGGLLLNASDWRI